MPKPFDQELAPAFAALTALRMAFVGGMGLVTSSTAMVVEALQDPNLPKDKGQISENLCLTRSQIAKFNTAAERYFRPQPGSLMDAEISSGAGGTL
jgi:hypothetical protein